MKCIMVMFDSLNRHFLPNYGCDWTHAPNFKRLGLRAATFDTSYVCSMPCMPARRELHTGRPNFLHRSWGPLEPFDDSMPEILKKAGVYTHLATDHYHYWEDGGATYHNRYSSCEFFRGQEGDLWKGQVEDPVMPSRALGRHEKTDVYTRQDMINRAEMAREADQPQPQTFRAGLEFIEKNAGSDNWYLQIETFDPHEPFFSHRKYHDLYDEMPHDPDLHFDWPYYRPVNGETESDLAVSHIRREYAALLSQCDAHLGDVLDAMDRHDMWQDTLLIVWTDHGFLLGEHNAWAKIWMPFYQEVAHTPFWIADPRCPGAAGARRQSLVQPSLDLAPTLLEFFGLAPTPDMLGRSLAQTVVDDTPVREAALFGLHGGQVNVTDGRYVYMRGAASDDNQPLFNYTLMPTTMRGFLPLQNLRQMEIAPPFSFTKDCSTLRIPARGGAVRDQKIKMDTLLYDVRDDPQETTLLSDAGIEAHMITRLTRLMRECDAPVEQYERLGLERMA